MATILIIDDLAADREILATVLRPHGHRILEAGDGREALASVRSERPDAIITDLLMPVMDGYELVRLLRRDAATRRIPVVFYTARYGAHEARALSQSSGVSYILTKPAASADVVSIVRRALAGEPQTAASTEAQPSTPAVDHGHLRLSADTRLQKVGELRAASARLRAVINIGLEIGAERDSERLLQRVCAAARDLFGASYVTLGLVDSVSQSVRRVVACGPGGCAVDTEAWIKPGDSLSGLLATVVDERRTLRGNNSPGDPAGVQLPPDHPIVEAFLAAPIASTSRVYGWICLVGNEGRTFTETDEHLIVVVAVSIGRLYDLEHEIVERAQAQTALRYERDRAQTYLDTAAVILLALDSSGRITLINRHACSVLGWSSQELIGRNWWDTCLPERVRPEIRQKFQNVLDGDLSVVENPVLTRSGGERLIEWHNTVLRDDAGEVAGTLSSGTDITERRILEQQYHQAQKMEAIGRLAGGVAHDFNNLLTSILGYAELLLADLDPSDPRRADILEIQNAGVSAAALTRQLLAFSRKEIIEPVVLDLNAVVTDMHPMLQRLIGDDINVAVRRGTRIAHIKADRGQVQQIVMNLAVNARDAMPTGGTLTIEIADVELDEHYAQTHLAVKPGEYVVLTVSDTGTGITPQVQARLFEPFFTTKGPGKGTGLGLATVHGIATRCGGCVNVYSEIGRGTSFKVYFPRAAAREMLLDAPRSIVDEPHAGGQTVLVVDDAEGPRGLARRLLEKQGYVVLVAANADEALRIFEQNGVIDVLLTDVVMPGASGPELTRRLIEQHPALKVIYMSGYTEDAIVHHGVLDPGITFLHKPFTSATLRRKMHEVLTSRPVAAL